MLEEGPRRSTDIQGAAVGLGASRCRSSATAGSGGGYTSITILGEAAAHVVHGIKGREVGIDGLSLLVCVSPPAVSIAAMFARAAAALKQGLVPKAIKVSS